MPKPSLIRGLDRRARIIVPADMTVPQLSAHLPAFTDMPPVIATAFLVAFVEATCVEAVSDHLSEGECTVGTLVNLSHIAPTPAGVLIKASVNLLEIEERTLRFSVAVWDGVGVLSDGWHERTIVDMSRFMDNAERRSGQAS